MPRKKRDASEPPLSESDLVSQLSELDLTKMLLNNARVSEAKAVMELAAIKLAQASMVGELNAVRLETNTNRLLAKAKADQDAAKAALASTIESSRLLAEGIAARYSVDWKSASFDPDSGRIHKFPGEMTTCPPLANS